MEEPGRGNSEIPKLAGDSSPHARITMPVINQALNSETTSCKHPPIAENGSCKTGTTPPVNVHVLGHGESSSEFRRSSDYISLTGSADQTNGTKQVAMEKISWGHANSENDSSSRKTMNPKNHTPIVSPVITPYRTVTNSGGQAASGKPYRTADVVPLKTRPSQSATYIQPDQTNNLNPPSNTMSIAKVIRKPVQLANPSVITSSREGRPDTKTENGTRDTGEREGQRFPTNSTPRKSRNLFRLVIHLCLIMTIVKCQQQENLLKLDSLASLMRMANWIKLGQNSNRAVQLPSV
jgi:hypothetical protein